MPEQGMHYPAELFDGFLQLDESLRLLAVKRMKASFQLPFAAAPALPMGRPQLPYPSFPRVITFQLPH